MAGTPQGTGREQERLLRLVNELDHPLLRAEAFREIVGCQMVAYEKTQDGAHLKDADKRILEAKAQFRTLPIQPPRLYLTLLRAEIEVLWLLEDFDTSMERVSEYLEVCHLHPIAHCIQQLQGLVMMYRFEVRWPDSVPPRHSFMLAYAYLDDRFVRL
jgi:hypothetical protein